MGNRLQLGVRNYLLILSNLDGPRNRVCNWKRVFNICDLFVNVFDDVRCRRLIDDGDIPLRILPRDNLTDRRPRDRRREQYEERACYR